MINGYYATRNGALSDKSFNTIAGAEAQAQQYVNAGSACSWVEKVRNGALVPWADWMHEVETNLEN